MTMLVSLTITPSSLSKVYFSSPFHEAILNDETKVTAIAITVVFSLLFLTGFIGHCFVLTFTTCRKRSPFSSAYVILGNLTVAQLLFVIACVPAIAYILLMGLVTSEWLFGDFACRLVPFVTVFLLGVTTFSFFAFAIDRFQHARLVNRDYNPLNESPLRKVCKMLVLWIGALILASPELFMTKTSEVALPVASGSNLTLVRNFAALPSNVLVLSKEEYRLYSEHRDFDSDESPGFINASASVYLRYEICEIARSWDESLPHPVTLFMENYAYFRDWWLLVFYFFFPVIFALLFALLVSRRLSQTVQNNNDSPNLFPGSYYVTSGIEGGTLTSQRDHEQISLIGPQNYASNINNHPHINETIYLQRGGYSLERQVSHNQLQRRLSPLLSTEDLQDASPTIVVSNGSLRTIDSSRRFPEVLPQSPVSPSFTTANGVSLLSLAMSNTAGNGGGTLGTASLPPHGHRRSIKRRSSKQTLGNVAREKRLNWVLVSLVVTFILTQLPLRVVSILRNQTELLSMLDQKYVDLIINLCLYLFVSSFVINPVILCLCYKSYRKFLARRCCC